MKREEKSRQRLDRLKRWDRPESALRPSRGAPSAEPIDQRRYGHRNLLDILWRRNLVSKAAQGGKIPLTHHLARWSTFRTHPRRGACEPDAPFHPNRPILILPDYVHVLTRVKRETVIVNTPRPSTRLFPETDRCAGNGCFRCIPRRPMPFVPVQRGNVPRRVPAARTGSEAGWPFSCISPITQPLNATQSSSALIALPVASLKDVVQRAPVCETCPPDS